MAEYLIPELPPAPSVAERRAYDRAVALSKMEPAARALEEQRDAAAELARRAARAERRDRLSRYYRSNRPD